MKDDISSTVLADIHTMLAERKIRQMIVRYCRSVDRQDWESVIACYHDNGVHDHGMFSGTAAQFVDYVRGHMAGMIGTMHLVGNTTIQMDGDLAHCETYAVAFHRLPSSRGGNADHTVWYRYLDRFECRDGHDWLIAERRIVYDWSRIDPVTREWQLGEGYLRGMRDASDSSIDWLASVTPDPHQESARRSDQ